MSNESQSVNNYNFNISSKQYLLRLLETGRGHEGWEEVYFHIDEIQRESDRSRLADIHWFPTNCDKTMFDALFS
jgi:hypothetical protein